MTTSIATLGREKRLSTLARNLFVIEGPNKEALQRRAERALLAANPRLATPEGFVSKATVIVPSVPGLRTSDRVITTSANLGGLLTEAGLRLQTSAGTLKERFARSVEDGNAALERLNDPGFIEAATKALPQSKDLLAQTQEAIKRRIDRQPERQSKYESAIDAAMTELAKLSERAKRTDRRGEN